jgi:hypothetical protein
VRGRAPRRPPEIVDWRNHEFADNSDRRNTA